jgi:glycosyltransferase involved in cell wall biosynthesis
MTKSKILVAQLGARKHYQEPLLFHQWGVLDSLYTDFYSGHSKFATLIRYSKIYNRLPQFIKKGLERYKVGLENAKILHFPKFGYQYAKALRKVSPQQASQVYAWAGQEFCQKILNSGLGSANTIYGFNSASLELFEHAKSLGIRCILDQTLAERSLVYQLLLEEEQRWSEWSRSPFTVGAADLELLHREQREQDLADRIICGSTFVKDSLVSRGISAEKISVVSLGQCPDIPIPQHKPEDKTPQQRGDGLRILFAGAVGLRKGIPYLMEALRQLQGNIPFTCKVVGSLQIKTQRVAEYSDVCDFVGIVPRSQMVSFYNWADVFVLPSICEGSAMVTYEALSWGLPIITTTNSGSVVRDGIDGFIIPVRDAKAIASKLIYLWQGEHQQRSVPTDTRLYLQQTFSNSEQILLNSIS